MSTFEQLVSRLAERLDAEPAVAPGLAEDSGIVLFPVDADTDPDEVLEDREAFLKEGALLFFYEPPTGEDDFVVALANTTDPLAVVERMGVRGTPGPDTHAVLGFLKELAATDPYDLNTITPHAVGGVFRGPPRNARVLARRVYESCPNVYENIKAILEEEPEAAEDLGLPEDLPWHDPIEVLVAVLGQGPEFFFFWDEP